MKSFEGKLALISDIHANIQALEAVYADAIGKGVVNFYCLGDVWDYGANPNEVTEFLESRGIPSLRGNHDHYILDTVSPHIQKNALDSHDWTKEHLAPESLDYLRGSEPSDTVEVNGSQILLVHASPSEPLEQYVTVREEFRTFGLYFSDERLLHELGNFPEATAFFCGHTHLPFIRDLGSGKFAVNVGSVGQPRDDDNRACYCITDGTLQGTEIVRVEYDISGAQEAIETAGLPEKNSTRLELGR